MQLLHVSVDRLAHVVVVLAHGALHSQIGRAEENNAGEEAADPRVFNTSSCEGDPVEVVCLPEASEECAALKNALLLCSVNATAIEETELEPGSARVAVGKSRLNCFPMLVRKDEGLGFVAVFVLAEVLSDVRVSFGPLF